MARREWRTKTFKSGNSIAVRIPKGVGLREGDDVVLVPHADGSISVWQESKAKAVFMALYGAMSPGWMAAGRGDIEQGDYEWGEASSAAA